MTQIVETTRVFSGHEKSTALPNIPNNIRIKAMIIANQHLRSIVILLVYSVLGLFKMSYFTLYS